MSLDNPIGFSPLSASEILAREPKPVKWILHKYIPAGILFLLVAFMKVGKSTFAYPLALAVARGIPFLGFKTNKGAVLILSLEEHPNDVERRLRKLGMKPDDPIYIHTGPLPCDAKAMGAIAAFIKEKEISLILVDSLPYWWDVKNENDNAQVIAAVKPILELARESGATIGLIHHTSKYGGRNEAGEDQATGRSIRGGSALFGLADQALILDRRHGGTKDQRVLKTIGRYSESPPELILELVGNTALSDPHPYGFHVLGLPEELTAIASTGKILEVLTDQPQDVPTLAERTGLNPKAIRELTEKLFQEGKALRDGKGAKGSPFTYRLAPDSNSILFQGSTNPSLGKESNNPYDSEEILFVSDGGLREEKETNPALGKPLDLDTLRVEIQQGILYVASLPPLEEMLLNPEYPWNPEEAETWMEFNLLPWLKTPGAGEAIRGLTPPASMKAWLN